MRALVGVGLAFLVLAGSAEAKPLSQKQKNVLNHLAQVEVIAGLCPLLKRNDVAAAILLTAYDIDFDDAAVRGHFKQQYQTQREPWMSVNVNTDPNPACLAGLLLYGPSGENVKNMMVRK